MFLMHTLFIFFFFPNLSLPDAPLEFSFCSHIASPGGEENQSSVAFSIENYCNVKTAAYN